ncbi:MAG: hypothetical protein Q8Q08_11455 [Candidatus Omnitrophota bacterium]|nr:hypothetical protein [Candidatus Omnitrophota bacterium]MDZ4243310.1 hypothetical protein [Candidatus Omnitrophota bacterium]
MDIMDRPMPFIIFVATFILLGVALTVAGVSLLANPQAPRLKIVIDDVFQTSLTALDRKLQESGDAISPEQRDKFNTLIGKYQTEFPGRQKIYLQKLDGQSRLAGMLQIAGAVSLSVTIVALVMGQSWAFLSVIFSAAACALIYADVLYVVFNAASLPAYVMQVGYEAEQLLGVSDSRFLVSANGGFFKSLFFSPLAIAAHVFVILFLAGTFLYFRWYFAGAGKSRQA